MEAARWDRKQISMRAAIRSANGIFAENFGAVFSMSAFLSVVFGAIFLLASGPTWMELITTPLGFLLTAWIAGAVVRVVVDVDGDGRDDLSALDLVKSIKSKLFGLALLGIVTQAAIVIGSVFLFVPGIFLLLMWSVAIPVMVAEDRGVFAAMARSADLTRYRRMSILGFAVVLVLQLAAIGLIGWQLENVSLILASVVTAGLGALAYPYLGILSAEIYFRLIEMDRPASPPMVRP